MALKTCKKGLHQYEPKDARNKEGCPKCARARVKRWENTPSGREVRRRLRREWSKTPAGRARQKRIDDRRVRVGGHRVRTFKSAAVAAFVRSENRRIGQEILALDKERRIA